MKPTKLSKITTGGAGLNTSGLRYPDKMIDADTDYVEIQFYTYRPPFSSEAFTQGSLEGYNKSASDLGPPIGGPIKLYMPQDISAQYGGNWQDMNISNIARSALGATGQAFNGDLTQAAGTVISQMVDTIKEGLTKGTATAKLLSETLQQTNFGNFSVNDIFAGITGEIFNPNTEVLYKGPQMRGFILDFKMVPESDTEARNIKDIIKTFKYAVLPEFGNASSDGIATFVKVPAIADVTFMSGGRPNENVSQFKPSALTDLDISYTPDGAWATYRDGTPVATNLRATFKELKMVYREEIEQGY